MKTIHAAHNKPKNNPPDYITKENTMLVLTRRKDEAIVIDGKIEIEVLKVKGNTVRLGIRAPRNVKILRSELSPFTIETENSESTATGQTNRQSIESFSASRNVLVKAG